MDSLKDNGKSSLLIKHTKNNKLTTPAISIIIPAFNVEKFIPRCLISLINQTLENIEIIVINDGSTDQTESIAKQFAKCDSRIKVLSQPNQKQGSARNRGISNSKGEYIAFIDADDWVSADFCEKMYFAAKSTNAEIACANIVRGDENRQHLLIEYSKQECFINIKEKFIKAKMPEYCFPCNKIFLRKALLEKNVTFKEGIFYEDMIFLPEAIINLGKMITVKDATYFYWKNQNSTIYKKDDSSRADKIFAVQYLSNICQKFGIKYNKPIKSEYYFLGLKLLKTYKHRATTYYYLFGFLPLFTKKDCV